MGSVFFEPNHLEVGADEAVEVEPKVVESVVLEAFDYAVGAEYKPDFEEFDISHEHVEV